MSDPTNPAELIQRAAQRHQAARDAAHQVSREIAEQRAKDAEANAPDLPKDESAQ